MRFARVTVRGQHRRRPPVPLDDKGVEIGGLCRVEALEGEIIDNY